MLTFNAYQTDAKKVAVYPNLGNNLPYATLGLAGEAGEVANVVKKIIRDSNGVITDEIREKLLGELGDVLWYVAACCWELDIDMGECANHNLSKLFSRRDRGVLAGSGDNR